MADGYMSGIFGSDDEGSGDGIDHIPKTPGPALGGDREHSEEEDDEASEKGSAKVKSDSEASGKDSGSDSDEKSDAEEKAADSEVERSDDEASDKESPSKPSKSRSPSKSDGSDSDVQKSPKRPVMSDGSDSDKEVVSPKKKKIIDSDDDEDDNKSEKSDKSKSPEKSGSEKSDKSPARSVNSDDEGDKASGAEKSDDEDAKKIPGTSTADIFGEMSSDEDEAKQGRDSDREDTGRRSRSPGERSPNEFLDPPEVEPIPEPTRIEVEIPRIVANLGKEINFVKLPNFLSVDTHPYDASWYEDEIDEDEAQDEEGRQRLKLKVENTIRWRNVVDKDGKVTRESNTRIVKWSDGSMSLHLGAEIFDVHKQQLMPGDNNHLFVRQGTGLQGQAVFKTKYTFRPHSTDSITHRKMTLSLADRSQKTQKIRVLPTVEHDPERDRRERMKKEEERLKASIRRESQKRRTRERAHSRGPSAAYLEPDGYDDDDDEGGISLSKIKNQFKRGPGQGNYAATYSESSSDDDSDLDFGSNKKTKAKAKIVEDSDDD